MTCIYFCNKGELDLDAVKIMGVSVKEESAIGYFGTGLKFAISTLLRTGHQVEIMTMGKVYPLTTEAINVRGKPFNVVKLGEDKLGFTTDTGKDWQVWQAYRELASNALDEGGVILNSKPAGDFDTIITVSGPQIEEAYDLNDQIFLQSQPLIDNEGVEFHSSDYNDRVYYRGVWAHRLPKPSLFTYNLTGDNKLTEDRTLADVNGLDYKITKAVVTSKDREFIKKFVFATNDFYESNISYAHYSEPSDEFMEVVEKYSASAKLNQGAFSVWNKWNPEKFTPESVDIDDFHRSELDKALKLVHYAGATGFSEDDFSIATDLGSNIFGMVRDDEIYISLKCFDMGYRFLAGTIYEEYLHKEHGYEDESRTMQNHLLDKLFAMIDRCISMTTYK